MAFGIYKDDFFRIITYCGRCRRFTGNNKFVNNAVLYNIAGIGRGIKAATVMDPWDNAVWLIEGPDITLAKFAL